MFVAAAAQAEGLVDSVVRRFAQSDFELMGTQSNVPFLPLAWLTVTGYQQSSFTCPGCDNSSITFRQSSISQGAFAPIPLGRRDAFVVGEWISRTHFDLRNAPADDLDVFSAALPLGWIRQAAPNWQLAAFVAPLGHTTHEDSWYWETLGGAFVRHATSDRTAWIVGAYFDVAPLEDFYTPYLGATFILNERWTINAVMPWPAVTYAPSSDVFFRFGVAPSGASWSIEPGARRPRMSLSAWNFGLAAERRIYKSVWLGAEIGVSGIRGLSIVGGDFQSLETKLNHSGFALLTLSLRPSPQLPNRGCGSPKSLATRARSCGTVFWPGQE